MNPGSDISRPFPIRKVLAYQRTPYIEGKRAEARERLVQAALGLLSRGGWREVQISAVAAAAGLSTGAVYLHFPSKTHLVAELYRAQASAELDILTEIANAPAPAAERIAQAIRSFAKRVMSNRRLGYAMVLEPTDIEVEEERLRFHAQFIEQYRRILDEGVKSGEFHVANTRVAAACIFGSLTESLMSPLGMSTQPITKSRHHARNDVTVLVDSVLAFCLNGLAGAKSTSPSAASTRRASSTGPAVPKSRK
jgi:AcrR family transcriptional regulator